jgi:curved DNA-binding protein
VTTTRDPYEVLGVARDADADEIRRAYRALARSHHPDVSKEAGAEERFKEIGEAYAVLSDPERRAAFDRGEEAGAAAGPGPQWGPAGADDGEGFEDLFEQLFGRPAEGSVRGHAFRARGADLEAVLELDLEEVAKGGSRRLTLGDGTTVEVAIPQGITQGQRIRLAGRGAPGLGDAPPGDLFLERAGRKQLGAQAPPAGPGDPEPLGPRRGSLRDDQDRGPRPAERAREGAVR